jgi:hypothetical protein
MGDVRGLASIQTDGQSANATMHIVNRTIVQGVLCKIRSL